MKALPRKATAMLLLCCFLGSSCATILSRKRYDIPISSTPKEATVKIVDRKGAVVYEGHTPTTVKLKASAGYFKRGEYTITFSQAGYDDQRRLIQSKIHWTYWLNSVNFLSGVVGYVVIASTPDIGLGLGLALLLILAAPVAPFLFVVTAPYVGIAAGALGALVLDPLTGDMYSLRHVKKTGVHEVLRNSTSLRFESETDDWVLYIRSMDELPTELHKDLEPVGRLEFRR